MRVQKWGISSVFSLMEDHTVHNITMIIIQTYITILGIVFSEFRGMMEVVERNAGPKCPDNYQVIHNINTINMSELY